MDNKKKIKNNLIFSILSKLVIIGVGLLLPRITMVNYGSEVNGLLNSAHQMVSYLTLFEAGVQAVALKALYAPVYHNNHEDINGILSAVNIQYKKTGTLYLSALIVISLVYALLIKSESVSFLTAFLLTLFSGLGKVVLFFFQGKYRILLQAEGKSYIEANLQTIISLLTGIVKVMLLRLHFDVVLITGISFLISLIQAGYIVHHIRKKYSWINLNAKPTITALKEKNSALVHQVSALVFQNTDVLIITFFCDLKVVSVYSIYKMIVSNLSAILYVVYDSFSFSMGQFFQTDRKKFVKMLDAVEIYYTAGTFAIFAVATVMLPAFISIYTQGVTDIIYVDRYLPTLFVVVEIMSVCRMPLLNTINYAGHFQKTLLRTIIETVINLTTSLVLVQFIGIYGVLLGTIAALLFRCTDVLFYVNRKILNRKSWRSLAVQIINVLIFVVVVQVEPFVNNCVNSYAEAVVSACILTPALLAVYFVAQSIFHKKEFVTIVNSIKKG